MRIKGSVAISTNYEPLISGPFDARSMVQYKSDLTKEATWIRPDGIMYIYDKMLVGVSKDTEENNGYYILLDKNKYNLESYWLKLADTKIINNIKENCLSKEEFKNVAETKKYEISIIPDGMLVNYYEKEIRIYCTESMVFNKQNPGSGGVDNRYYVPLKAYAPSGASSFKKDLDKTINDDTMFYFENNDFAGVDEYGRKFSIVWLPIAETNDGGLTWKYFGEESTIHHYIGFDYSVEWYNDSGVIIGKDTIRINLANAECYNSSAITTDEIVIGEKSLILDCGNANI